MNLSLRVSTTALLATLILSTDSLANELTHKGKPLDPLCIHEAESSEAPVRLSRCGLEANHLKKSSTINEYMRDQGYIGYEYTWKDTGYSGQGSSYYKYLGKLNSSAIVLTFNNTGGTGNFTNLSSLKIQDDAIRLQTIASGDRCNGGVTEAKLENEALLFDVNITAYDLFDLGKKASKVKAYDDLAACAICCIGTARYRYTLNTRTPQLEYVQVDTTQLNDATQGRYQSCFNQQLHKFIGHDSKLSKDQITQFANQFYRACVTHTN